MNPVAWAARGGRADASPATTRSVLRPLRLLVLACMLVLAGCASAGRSGAGPTPAQATATHTPAAATVYAGFSGRGGLGALRGDSGALRWQSAPQPMTAPSVSGGVAYAAACAGATLRR